MRAAKRLGLLPFVPAGYPNLETTAALLPALESAGASALEIGFPFSDPIADGPIIQEAFAEALARGVRIADVFRTIGAVRPAVSVPLVAMVSYSIVFRYGTKRFIDNAKSAGFDAILLPDLPPPEAQAVCEQIRSADLDTILLVAPTTSPQRRRQIASLCSGFVYYLSVSGTTGERDQLPPDVLENVRQIRAINDCPVCVGFGISRPEHVAQLRDVADGAIVGSALVREIKQHRTGSAGQIARSVAETCRQLMSQVTTE